jgi:hypothetical protein
VLPDLPDQASPLSRKIKKVTLVLTSQQRAAIRDYTERGYQQMNHQLRDGEVTKQMQLKVEKLNGALERLPDFRGDVYRGTTINQPSLLDKYREVGSEVVEDAFTSASRSPLKMFAGNARFYLSSKHGKEIARWSAHPEEEEVLFKPGTRFKVLDFLRSGPNTEIFLEEL